MENEKLTKRQLEILQLLDEGLNRKMAAEKLSISKGTVNTQLNLIYKILDAHSVSDCLHKAREKGLLPGTNKNPPEKE